MDQTNDSSFLFTSITTTGKKRTANSLFQDLMKLHNSDRRSHFFGSIVSSIQSGTEDRFIIDGQQRITTVSLLLIAMANAKKEGLIDATDAKLVEKIFKRYLVDEYQEDERKVKLKPIKKDMQAFDALLYKPKEQYTSKSRMLLATTISSMNRVGGKH